MKERPTATDKVVQSVLANAGVLGAKELEAWKRPQDDIRRLSQRDYTNSLRRQLTYEQIKELVQRATDIWPHFNQSVLGPPSKEFFSRAADALQLHLKAARYHEPRPVWLLRRPVRNTALTKPLIFVNSAHHALAMGTTFCHEVGHHFCTEIAKPKASGIRFYFDAAYNQHLHDRSELAADVIVSLAGYPKAAAKTIFTARRTKRYRAQEAISIMPLLAGYEPISKRHTDLTSPRHYHLIRICNTWPACSITPSFARLCLRNMTYE